MIPPDSGQQPPSNYAKSPFSIGLSYFSHIAENAQRVTFHPSGRPKHMVSVNPALPTPEAMN
jgi:hypothetical protein